MVLHLSFSNLSDVLTFNGTHFGERLNLLTLIILGEGKRSILVHPRDIYLIHMRLGCIILAKSVTLLVKDTFIKDVGVRWSRWQNSVPQGASVNPF